MPRRTTGDWRFTGDFNGDSKPDYVLYNVGTHQTAIWYLNNNVYVGGGFGPTLPNGWAVVGAADFDRMAIQILRCSIPALGKQQSGI